METKTVDPKNADPKSTDPRFWRADALKAGVDQWWHAVEGSRKALDQLGQQLQATARAQAEAVRGFTRADAAPGSTQSAVSSEDLGRLAEAIDLLDRRATAERDAQAARLQHVEEAVGALAAQIGALAQTVSMLVGAGSPVEQPSATATTTPASETPRRGSRKPKA